jgi:hypothetical protein
MRVSEWIGLGFFVYLAAVAVLRRAEVRSRRLELMLVGVGISYVVRTLLVGDAVIRDWWPVVDLLLAYWLPALIAPPPDVRWERRFLASDRRWLGADIEHSAGRPSIVFATVLEFSYLLCYPMIPLGIAILFFGGFRGDADRFWTSVLLAVLPCYGMVLWLPMRPPRMVEGTTMPVFSSVRALNLRVLRRASIQLNTFPSAHVSGSIATACAVAARFPVIGVALGLIAAGITIGSVLRRYHYLADALTGVALGLLGVLTGRILTR